MSRQDGVQAEFDAAVNMTASELERWLDTAESKEVGQRQDGGESVGHESGRRIVTLLRAKRRELSAQDAEHMRKVVGISTGISRSAHPGMCATPGGASH